MEWIIQLHFFMLFPANNITLTFSTNNQNNYSGCCPDQTPVTVSVGGEERAARNMVYALLPQLSLCVFLTQLFVAAGWRVEKQISAVELGLCLARLYQSSGHETLGFPFKGCNRLSPKASKEAGEALMVLPEPSALLLLKMCCSVPGHSGIIN